MNYKFLLVIVFSVSSFADDVAVGHAPIGVMADHFHKSGEIMISARYSNMQMKGNALHDQSIDDQTIITTQENPFASMSGAPDYLSVVPQKMDMEMLMLGGMYAPSDDITLMGMIMFMKNKMELNTYRGMMARDFLGNFKTSNEDISNISVSALYKLNKSERYRLHMEVGIDKSLGDEDKKHKMLTPANANMMMVMPYAMQQDNATRLIIGFTNNLEYKNYFVGSQIRMKTAIADKDWSFGNKLELSSWVQKPLNDELSISARLQYINQKKISGSSSIIFAPVQSANPLNYGGKTIRVGFGLNALFDFLGGDHKDRLGIEILFPVNESKNGLQMEEDYEIQFGYQKTF